MRTALPWRSRLACVLDQMQLTAVDVVEEAGALTPPLRGDRRPESIAVGHADAAHERTCPRVQLGIWEELQLQTTPTKDQPRVVAERFDEAEPPIELRGHREVSRRQVRDSSKYVVSSTLERVDWNAELVRGDLGEAVQQLKREPGKGLLMGGVGLNC
jgi:hypothetical protein